MPWEPTAAAGWPAIFLLAVLNLSRAEGLAAVSEMERVASLAVPLRSSAWEKPSFSWVKRTVKSPVDLGKAALREEPAVASFWGMALLGVVTTTGGSSFVPVER